MECSERRDLILLYATGGLDVDECGGLREHLAGGCPQCAGYLAEAEATLALLGQTLPPQLPPPLLRQAILNRAKQESRKSGSPNMRIGGWDRIVLPAAVAAVLAVAVTLFAVRQFASPIRPATDDSEDHGSRTQLLAVKGQYDSLRQSLKGMQFAELTGPAQPEAVGRVFIDPDMKKWYFFTCGMRPVADGKTYNYG